MNIDEQIYIREKARDSKDFKACDDIRNELDKHLVFIFDTPNGQQIYYLTDSYFKRKPENVTHRQYLESRIKADIRADKLLEAWIASVRHSMKWDA